MGTRKEKKSNSLIRGEREGQSEMKGSGGIISGIKYNSRKMRIQRWCIDESYSPVEGRVRGS